MFDRLLMFAFRVADAWGKVECAFGLHKWRYESRSLSMHHAVAHDFPNDTCKRIIRVCKRCLYAQVLP